MMGSCPCGGSQSEEIGVMGRGRAKAKQVKVARRLKYGSVGGDLERLRRELDVGASPSQVADGEEETQGGPDGSGGDR